MTNANIRLYNDTHTALNFVESGLIIFNNRFTEHNKRELENYINKLDRAKAGFEIYYTGPELIKLQVLEKIQGVRDEAIIAIIEFNQLSSI